ncbi:MAG: aminopeptidase P family protein [Chloroflexi bacterium HGW-Chloroflexi-3]|nr:MAG: aminopeptidase P family protein [Chloroflexi bacterium HGW-Chloroflexi-3]
MHSQRLKKLIDLMASQNLDAIALNPGYSMRYLTNLDFHLMERPTVLFIKNDGKIAFILPKLESTRAERSFSTNQLFTYGDNPATWSDVFKTAVDHLRLGKSKVGVESTGLRFLEFNFIKTSSPESEIISANEVFASFRVIKDQSEILLMKKAAQIAQRALLDTLQEPIIGKSEKELASLLTINLLKNGSGELPFLPIVASGANSADPHATPSEHIIQPGELLLFDWGANYEGYASDITRTFAVGDVDPIFYEIANIVRRANRKGLKSAMPGVTAGSIDDATREVISQSGYGEYFFHRTGHGLGMEAHETPYIFSENSTILEPGMVFTVEPGIYLSGKGGVRIEDDVVITENGAESITDLPRELRTIR